MSKGRLEAFSDGVIAILITIMVLELKVPHGASWEAIESVLPTLCQYLLSFVFVAIYWNNHHHLLQAATHINGKVLWANQHLLFWLSLIPFATSWMGENHFAALPTAFYGVVLFCCAVAFTILLITLIGAQGKDSKLAQAIGNDFKGKLSLVLYATAIPTSFYRAWMAEALYVLVALLWLVPDPRIERKIAKPPVAHASPDRESEPLRSS